MMKNQVLTVLGPGIAVCLMLGSLSAGAAAQEADTAPAGAVPQPGQPEAVETAAPIAGSLVDESGAGIADDWLTFVTVGDPALEVHATFDDSGHFRIDRLPAGGADAVWTIGEIGSYDSLPISVAVETLDADGNVVGDPQSVEYQPGHPLPEFRVPADGSVRVRVVMGPKADVARRWAQARREAKEARDAAEPQQRSAVSGEASQLWAAGNAKFGERDYAGALADYDAALEAAPGEPRLLAARASALFYVGDFAEARKAAEAALEAGSGDVQLLLLLADRFIEAQDAENAEGTLASLAAASPDNPEVHVRRARWSKKQGDVASAVAAYDEATRLSPDNPKLWKEMATFCRENGEDDCARRAYGELVTRSPEFDRTAYYFLGTLSEGAEAIAYFEKAARTVPEAYVKLCVAHHKAGDDDKAEEACRRYLELRPNDAQAGQVRALLESITGGSGNAPPAP